MAAIKFVYFDLTKIRFFEIPWFFPDFQQNLKFPDFSLQGFFSPPFSLFSRVRGHPVNDEVFKMTQTLLYKKKKKKKNPLNKVQWAHIEFFIS